jgi:hypothetical protein
MQRAIVGIICMVVGGALIAFRERFARAHVESQNRMWGFRFGERERLLTRIVAVIAGLGLLVSGILLLAGIMKFQSTG